MNLKQPFIIQVIGYKNSGKTTLVCQLIEGAKKIGLNSATIKHHGHGGKPDVNSSTDSSRHKQAGSVMSGVEGDGELLLSITQPNWSLQKILSFYELIEIDLILIEGYKRESFPKIVLLTKEEDLCLLSEVTNICAIIASFDIQIKNQHIPIFLRDERLSIEKWFVEFILKNMPFDTADK